MQYLINGDWVRNVWKSNINLAAKFETRIGQANKLTGFQLRECTWKVCPKLGPGRDYERPWWGSVFERFPEVSPII